MLFPLPGGLLVLLAGFASAAEDVKTTRVFIMQIEPGSFNWTNIFSRQGYWFRASILGNPDLPKWLSYTYSKRHRSGFLYGVPPPHPPTYDIELIGVNRQTYETVRRNVQLSVSEKPDPAKYEVELKIDNVNIEDMFEEPRLGALLGVFTNVLWEESKSDLYLTFLDSAVKLGARKPIKPNESDGVVMRLGSKFGFSKDLLALQEEVRPLSKLSPCPRDFKRTTVDRHFRANGFILDWCSFRLGTDRKVGGGGERHPRREELSWRPVSRDQLPTRSYKTDLLATILLPLIILLIMALLLSLILCFHHEGINKECEDSEETLTQYEAVQRATNSLRSLSTVRDPSPRLTAESGEAGRPNPPPYAATRRNVHRQDS